MQRRLRVLAAVLLTILLMMALPGVLRHRPGVAGLQEASRELLRIWIVSSPGGGQAWLTQQLRAWEKQQPGVMTYLRTVAPEECFSPDAVLPDVILYMPGDFTAPETLFTPLSGSLTAREPLLRCGRWQWAQYGLPLCWGAWVLAIDSALEPGTAVTPAPTTLLGRPSATAAPSAAPGYLLEAVSAAGCALQSPGGAALLSLQCLLPQTERPPLPDNIAQLTPAEVYAAFQARKCATAMLTTGQATAFTSLVSAGKGFPFRILVPGEIITDQVWLASIPRDAAPGAAALLTYLTGTDAQQALTAQGLHTVRDDLRLYAAGFSAEVEQAAACALSAMNAYLPSQEVHSAAWQALQGTMNFSEALLPLL